MQNKIRYTFLVEPEKLTLLKGLYSGAFGDPARVLRAAVDTILGGAAEDPGCPPLAAKRIRKALAEGEDNRPPRPVFDIESNVSPEEELEDLLNTIDDDARERMVALLEQIKGRST